MQRPLCTSAVWRRVNWKRKSTSHYLENDYFSHKHVCHTLILTLYSDISNVTAMASLRLSQPHLHQAPPQPTRTHHQPSPYSGIPQAQTHAHAPASIPAQSAPQPAAPAPAPVPIQIHSHRPSGTAAPLTAPQPVRAAVPPPSVPTPGMWSPEMGIRFDSAGIPPGANTGPATAAAGRAQPGTWDPSQGVRFS
jgi:programmed cell death 6-interacting protein